MYSSVDVGVTIAGVSTLVSFLEKNTTLESLGISSKIVNMIFTLLENIIRDNGAEMIAKALATNTKLSNFDLRYNKISLKFREMLKLAWDNRSDELYVE